MDLKIDVVYADGFPDDSMTASLEPLWCTFLLPASSPPEGSLSFRSCCKHDCLDGQNPSCFGAARSSGMSDSYRARADCVEIPHTTLHHRARVQPPLNRRKGPKPTVFDSILGECRVLNGGGDESEGKGKL